MKILKIVLFFLSITALFCQEVQLKFEFEDSDELHSISKDIAMLSGTLKNILEDAFSDDAILLPNIEKTTSTQIIFLLGFIYKNKEEGDFEESLKQEIESVTKKNNIDLINLANAANFLDIKALISATLSLIKEKYKNETLLDEELLKLSEDLIDLMNIYDLKSTIDITKYSHISSNGNIIVATTRKYRNNFLYILDINGDEIGHNSDRNYQSVSISSDGNTIAAQGADLHIYVFDKFGREIGSSNQEIYYSEDRHRTYQIPYINGNTIVAVESGGKHILYILNERGQVISYNPSEHTYAAKLSLSSDGNTIVAVGFDFSIHILNRDGEVIASNKDRRYLPRVSISSDGSAIAAIEANRNHNLYILDKNGNVIGHNSQIQRGYYPQLSLSSDGSTIVAVGQRDKHLYVFNRDGEIIASNKDRKYDSVFISSDGNTIIASDNIDSNFENLYIFEKITYEKLKEKGSVE